MNLSPAGRPVARDQASRCGVIGNLNHQVKAVRGHVVVGVHRVEEGAQYIALRDSWFEGSRWPHPHQLAGGNIKKLLKITALKIIHVQ